MADAPDELRVEDVAHECRDVTCAGCGRQFTLWMNGGELDHRECCGFMYSLEMVRVDFVITPRPLAAAPSTQETSDGR